MLALQLLDQTTATRAQWWISWGWAYLHRWSDVYQPYLSNLLVLEGSSRSHRWTVKMAACCIENRTVNPQSLVSKGIQMAMMAYVQGQMRVSRVYRKQYQVYLICLRPSDSRRYRTPRILHMV